MVRLEKFYNETVRANMMKKFSYKNPLSVPRLEKIVMNMCIKEATQDTKKLDSAFNDMKNISGQRQHIHLQKHPFQILNYERDRRLVAWLLWGRKLCMNF